MQTYREVPYKTIDGHTLNLQVFEPNGHPSGRACPGIVFFIGSGWVQGNPEQFFPHASYFASRGMVAICAEYRLQAVHGTTPFECVKDGRSAIRWVRAHAAELGIDPKRLAAGGGSAGGQVAAAAGMLTAFDEEGEDLSVSCRPDALVLFNPVFDNGPGGYGHERVQSRWREFSPKHNIRAGAPPTIVFLGTEDPALPVATAEEYGRLMKEAGCRCEVHTYEGQPHGATFHSSRAVPLATIYPAFPLPAALHWDHCFG